MCWCCGISCFVNVEFPLGWIKILCYSILFYEFQLKNEIKVIYYLNCKTFLWKCSFLLTFLGILPNVCITGFSLQKFVAEALEPESEIKSEWKVKVVDVAGSKLPTAADMQIQIQVHKCGFRSGRCLFSNDLVADKAEPCGSIALKGSSSLMGFLCDANVERQPLPLAPSDMLSRTHTHIHLMPIHLALCTEQTQEHVLPFQTCSCDTHKHPAH